MKQVLFGGEASKPLLEGINAVANAVRVTAGPRGRTVILNTEYGVGITKDGVTVARAVELEDPIQSVGAALIKEVAHQTLKEGGDGTTTAVILAQAMIQKGVSEVQKLPSINPVEMKKGIDHAVEFVTQFIKDNALQVGDDMNLLKNVAIISANGDEEIGSLIFEAYSKIGKDGILLVEESNSVETYGKDKSGIQFDRGYLNPHFINDMSNMRVNFKSPAILVCDFEITNLDDIVPVLEYSAKNSTAVVIVAPNIAGDALPGLVINKQRGVCHCAAVKAPFGGGEQNDFLRDLCAATGAVMIEQASGGFKNQSAVSSLGKCDSIVITKDQTTITRSGEDSRITEHIAGIEKMLADAETDSQKQYYTKRIARIRGNISVLYVGGATETAMKEKRDRVDDAVQAVKCAIAEGVVPGGATIYQLAANAYQFTKDTDENHLSGENIVIEALHAPFNQLCENSGIKTDSVPREKILEGEVYDFKNFKLLPKGSNVILDPAKVERLALTNAASIAGVFLQTHAVVSHK